MKRILGLDLGTNSIGWAVVNEKENVEENSTIIGIGIRDVPLSADEKNNFEEGKPITTNADRRMKRSMRRNLQRYKLRRERLVNILKRHGFIDDETVLAEQGNKTTFETYRLRAKAATEKISLGELARVLLMINKKRGYKSNRKVKSQEEGGQLIDGMAVAKKLYDEGLTPGQYIFALLGENKKCIPDFYHSDLQAEFDRIWNFQRQYYPEILVDELKNKLVDKNGKQTWAICSKPFDIKGIKRDIKGEALRKENYEWRVKGLSPMLDLEQLAIVLQEINSQLANSSGYLGNISDRSKKLYFNKQTIGQFQMEQLDRDPNYSLKNQVFYRQDYLDEFEKIWETQSVFHKELSAELKNEIRNTIIFYQRPLKSQKNTIGYCEFESREIEKEVEGKKKRITMGLRVCPKSSPLYQEFRIWQTINNVRVSGMVIPEAQLNLFGESVKYTYGKRFLTQQEKDILFKELNIKRKLSKSEVLRLLFKTTKDVDVNFKEIKGNSTMAALAEACLTIVSMSGHDSYELSKKSAEEVEEIIFSVFHVLGYDVEFLHFDFSLEGKAFTTQPAYRLWHLLYSFEDDDSKLGNEKLIAKISELYGFDKEYASVIANVVFEADYGSLSAKAIRKILPYMRKGMEYSEACEKAGYRHSKRSLSKEEIAAKPLRKHIAPLRHNSLRNPVVEKILNQMINVVNAVIDEYGTFDEIRIEMARDTTVP